MKHTGPVSIHEGLWWVGDTQAERSLRCNPYLLIEGGSKILFDPGSVLDAEIIIEQVKSLTPIEEIDAIVLSHQDPDLCSSLPLFEQHGFSGVLCCHERTASIIIFYGINSQFYHVNTHKYHYNLKDGSHIKFLPAPYLHFPGAIMTYLPKQRTLLSGDLFGAFSKNWSLYAGDEYAEAMKSFHESYMPSHNILQPVMEQLLSYDIQTICPQHGSIITGDTTSYIEILRDLPCGNFIDPVRKDLLEAGGYISLCSQVLKRYFAIYGSKAVRETFMNSHFALDYKKKEIRSSSLKGDELWEEFFVQVYQRKDMSWLTIVSPFVESLTKQYAVALPQIFNSVIFDSQKNLDLMGNQQLELEKQKQDIEDSRLKCPVTKLFNQKSFDIFMNEQMEDFYEHHRPFSLMLLSIDNLADINISYGSEEGNAAMQNLSYLLTQMFSGSSHAFRLEGSLFSLYLREHNRDTSIKKANAFKNSVYESRLFLTPVSISIGLYHAEEVPIESIGSPEDLKQIVLQTARFRLRIAKRRGKNSLVYESDQENNINAVYTILIIDEPGLPLELICRSLERDSYHVVTAHNGLEARELAESLLPDIIISEQMTSKLSAFTLRKELLDNPETRQIPFILLTYNKQAHTVERAIALGITYILPRPVILTELLGIVSLLTSKLKREEL